MVTGDHRSVRFQWLLWYREKHYVPYEAVGFEMYSIEHARKQTKTPQRNETFFGDVPSALLSRKINNKLPTTRCTLHKLVGHELSSVRTEPPASTAGSIHGASLPSGQDITSTCDVRP